MITISKTIHKNEIRIKIISQLHPKQIKLIKKINGRRWSKTMNCWHIPYTRIAYKELQILFGKGNIKLELSKENQLKNEVIQKAVIKQPKFIIVKNKNNQYSKIVIGEELIVNQIDKKKLAVYVPYAYFSWQEIVKKINGRQWNNDKKYWEVPYVKDSIKQLCQIEVIHFNFVILNDIPDAISTVCTQKKDKPKVHKTRLYELLNDRQRRAIDALEEMLSIERKSWQTTKTYKTHMIGLLRYYPKTKPSQITNQQIKKYLFHKIKNDKIAETTQGQILNAFVAFYKRLLNQEEKLVNLKRPKKPKKLPNILSKEAITQLLKATKNIKHKVLLMLAYSAGLRKKEVINLRKKDIFFDRKCIFVKAGKGKKDRYVLLSQKVEKYLKEYLIIHKPKYWLFEGKDSGQYSATSIQKIFTNAKIKSNVNPYVTFHGLRHSFATHAIENNVPIHVVKELLGHSSIKTTEVYLHISNKFRKEFRSPLDDLDI